MHHSLPRLSALPDETGYSAALGELQCSHSHPEPCSSASFKQNLRLSIQALDFSRLFTYEALLVVRRCIDGVAKNIGPQQDLRMAAEIARCVAVSGGFSVDFHELETVFKNTNKREKYFVKIDNLLYFAPRSLPGFAPSGSANVEHHYQSFHCTLCPSL
jgi:hypothetical protein